MSKNIKKEGKKQVVQAGHSQDRDSARALLDRAADQDLVPKPSDEVEEGAQDGEHECNADAPNAPCPRIWPPSPPPGSLQHTMFEGGWGTIRKHILRRNIKGAIWRNYLDPGRV